MHRNRDKKGIYFIIAIIITITLFFSKEITLKMIKNRPSQIGVIYELFDK